MTERAGHKFMIRGLIWLVILAVCWAGAEASAGIYSYKDEYGHIHITDRPPNNKYRLLLTSLKRPKGFTGPVDTGLRFDKKIDGYAKKTGLSYPLLLAMIKTESNFNPRAVSHKGAKGLMQLMPGVIRRYGVTDPFDPEQNIRAGTGYFREMLARYKDLNLALAAYNAGPGAVDKYKGVPPFEETRGYIRKINWYHQYYRQKENLVNLPGVSREFNEGFKALSEGDSRLAAGSFKRVIRSFPGSPEANFNLALAHERIGNLSRAMLHYQKALRSNPYFKEAYYNLAIIFERIGQVSWAISTWQKYLLYEIKPEERREVREYIRELHHLLRQ